MKTNGEDKSIQLIEDFLALVDSGRLFSQKGAVLSQIRQEVRNALGRLLIWERPSLETNRGIRWPYEELKRRSWIFEQKAKTGANDPWQAEALLFLGLLPFPGQWARLLALEQGFSNHPDIQRFLAEERAKITDKIYRKPQRHYRLRHFCQILKGFQSPKEKGILRIFYLPYLWIRGDLLQRISRRYVFYIEPPMGVVFRHEWWRYYSALEDPCLFGIGAEEDMAFLAEQPHVEAVPLAHGDFMEDPVITHPLMAKKYDIVFNATFDDMPRKRHALMLKLLGHPLLQNKRALFLGRGHKSNVEQLKKLVRQAGLGNRVTVRANLPRADIARRLSGCKMGVHLSLYENACRSIYEFFRADLPCVISSAMGGMNLSIFNARTGTAVPDQDLADAIHHVLNHREQFKPRQWFLENSGSNNSTRKLNEYFRVAFERWGYAWRQDVVPLGSSGASRYVNQADYECFKSEFEWLLKQVQKARLGPLTFAVE